MIISRAGRAMIRVGTAAAVLAVSGCILKTDIVGAAFNGGALDSNGDPFRVPSQLAASRVERIVEQEVVDGYFRQGSPPLSTGEVGTWLDAQAGDVSKFVETVDGLNRRADTDAGLTAAERTQTCKKQHDKNVSGYTTVQTPICKALGSPDPRALELFLDDIRFKEATFRAARRVAALKLEGLIDDTAVHDGALEAFTRASRYVKNRKWVRRQIQKTAGLAVEGGAASGIFSAGAVWVVLNLINGWKTQPCPPNNAECTPDSKDVGFRLISGTSTGAMVAVAVDRFNSMQTIAGRQTEIDNVAKWFTCFSFKDLMCVQSTGIDSLLGGSKPLYGVLKFDGIEKVLTSCVKQWMFDNVSELILNTTEFRSGRIFALSDQNEMTKPADVVHASLASALLPIIGDPDTAVWDGVKFDPPYDSNAPERTRPAYLDGGIRSELPILPLVRRGAERILAVASGASTITEVKRLDSAIDVAPRYININTGSVTETEVEYAQRVAESARQAEIAACMGALDENQQLCPPKDCNAWNVCHGDLANACQSDMKALPADRRKAEDQQTIAQRCEPFWKMETIFVDNSSVDGLSGYNFQPSELRRLFRAGAEAARVRCLDLARLLAIVPEKGATSEQIADANRWCAASMPSTGSLCGQDVPQTSATFVARACLNPQDLTKLPRRLDACFGNDVPK